MSESTKISRMMTLSAIVQAITTYGPISRASVAKMTGFSKQTVSEVVSTLEGDGWVQTVGRTEGNVGRRAVMYEIVPEAALVASVDLGGTKVRVALCNLSGSVVSEVKEPTVQAGGVAVVDQIARLVVQAAHKASIPTEKIRVAVVGVPGVLEVETGNIKMAPNIAGIDQVDFPSLLEARLRVEVIVENDVNLAALGEHWMTHQGERDNLVFLSVGTGIGAGLVIGGQLVRGSSGGAGEIGFLPFGADPYDAESFKVGALERVTATSAMIGNYASLTGQKISVPEIFERSLSGDKDATQALATAARNIALAIAAIVAVVDPSCIVVGGSIGARPELVEMIRSEIKTCFPRQVSVEPSVLGNHAALAGGASIALSRLHISLFSGGLPGTKINVPPPELDTYQGEVA